MTADAPKHRLLRIAICLMLSVGVGLGILLLGVAYERKIHPGYDTTRIISPKLPDGSIDYLAAVEDHFGQGVTPENNAAVPILQAIGRKGLSPDQPRDGITNRLGMPPLPNDGDYFVTFDEYKHDHPADDAADTTEPDLPSKWPVTISPLTAQWIKANEKPLSLFTEASKRSRYFIPFNGGHRPATMMSILLPHLARINNARRAISDPRAHAIERWRRVRLSTGYTNVASPGAVARNGFHSGLSCHGLRGGSRDLPDRAARRIQWKAVGRADAPDGEGIWRRWAISRRRRKPSTMASDTSCWTLCRFCRSRVLRDRANLLRGAFSIDAPDAVLAVLSRPQ